MRIRNTEEIVLMYFSEILKKMLQICGRYSLASKNDYYRHCVGLTLWRWVTHWLTTVSMLKTMLCVLYRGNTSSRFILILKHPELVKYYEEMLP